MCFRFFCSASSLGQLDYSLNDNINEIDPTLYDKSLRCQKPEEIFQLLNKHIVGQEPAKKAVSIALRDRWRRQLLSSELQNEVTPKNILMIGPTGVGKTEIARRLADLTDSPFIKVEATKFTTVGYHGRDVETIIKDLVNLTHSKIRKKIEEIYEQPIREKAEDNILNILTQSDDLEGKNVYTREVYRNLIRSGEWAQKTIEDENGDKKTIAKTLDELIEKFKDDFLPEIIRKETIKIKDTKKTTH